MADRIELDKGLVIGKDVHILFKEKISSIVKEYWEFFVLKDQLKNRWIREYNRSWGNQIVLSAKPYQEHVKDIKDFIWWRCVSYCRLNLVKKPFEHPIPCCNLSVTIFDLGPKNMKIITVDLS